MGIGLIGKAAGDQRTYRLTNQSPAVLVVYRVSAGMNASVKLLDTHCFM